MRSLRSYSRNLQDDGEALFANEFGFLCFRVILLLVQVGILARANALDAFASDKSDVSDPNDISVALSIAAAQLVLDAAKKEDSREKLFGAFKSQDGERVSLWTAGNVGGVDVEFLTRLIWRSRKELLQICTEVASTGWSFALLLLGEHLRWALEADQWLTAVLQKLLSLRMLCYRQILVAPSQMEISYLTKICISAEELRIEKTEELYADAIQDLDDAKILMAALARRMKPSPNVVRLPAWIAERILGWFIQYHVMHDFTDLIPEFLKTTYSWIWAELAGSVAQGPSYARAGTVQGARGVWKDLQMEIFNFVKVYDMTATSSNHALASSYPDWAEIRHCFDTQFPHHRVKSQWIFPSDIGWGLHPMHIVKHARSARIFEGVTAVLSR
ncbi:hypothetical protein FRC10_009434 [Ceratobasidium sp. 414]|nr:hypothetical protein FRC10_009434 [Ceratobasidium sp. 414]